MQSLPLHTYFAPPGAGRARPGSRPSSWPAAAHAQPAPPAASRPRAGRSCANCGDRSSSLTVLGHFTTSQKDAPQMRRAGRKEIANKALTDGRTAPVGEYNRPTGLDDRRALRRHDIRAQIEFARRDADHGDQQRCGKPYDHDLEMRGAICPVKGPVHDILRGSTPWSPRPEKSSPVAATNVGTAWGFPRTFTER